MGLDVYTRWEGHSDGNREMAIQHDVEERGQFGVLHESFNGGPYAIPFLVPEGCAGLDVNEITEWARRQIESTGGTFAGRQAIDPSLLARQELPAASSEATRAADDPDYWVIPNHVLRARLPVAEQITRERYTSVYEATVKLTEKAVRNFRDFVAFHGDLEGDGLHPEIRVSY